MRLQVNEEKSGVRKPYDVHFLGFRFSCETESGEVAVFPSGKAERRLKATMREMTPPHISMASQSIVLPEEAWPTTAKLRMSAGA